MSKLSASLLVVAFSTLASVATMPRAVAQQAVSSLSPGAAVLAYCASWSTADHAKRERLLARAWAPVGV